MRITFSFLTVLFLSLSLTSWAYATPQVLTSVSNNSVIIGDIFTLSIEIDDSDSDYQLDTRPLEQDFTVLRPSKSQRTEYINGTLTQQTNWNIRLQATRTGEITIPALNIGPVSSEQLKITVSPMSEAANKSINNQVFIENSIDKNSVYIGQSITLTANIFIAQATDNLQLIAPTLSDANVEVYGEDQNSQTIRNGIRYRVISRQYKIIPNQAGEFTLNSPLLSGDIRKVVKVSDWQNKVLAEPINIRGESFTLDIKAKPESYQGEWLVSEDVRLIENVNLSEQTFHVGDPITRNISLLVAATDKDKLPIIDFNYSQDMRFYPDQDELSEGKIEDKVYAQRVMRHAIIADQTGELLLPEIKIAWWNSVTDQQQFATLPAQKITILASNVDDKDSNTVSVEASPQTAEENNISNNTEKNDNIIYWQISNGLVLLLLIVFIFYHLSYRRQQMNKQPKNTPIIAISAQSYIALKDALQQNNPTLVYKTLLTYLQNDYPQLKSLAQLNHFVVLADVDKKQLTIEIADLEKACSGKNPNWTSSKIKTSIEKHLNSAKKQPEIDIMKLN